MRLVENENVDSCDISFIIPVYNADKYIEKCVNSILQQNMDNFEIILVNDGSTDQSLEVCLDLQKRNRNIVVINQINKGQGGARNTGIKYARGIWLCFVDNDDWLEPIFFNEIAKYLKGDSDIILFAKREIYTGFKKDYLLNINQPIYIIDSDEKREILQLFTLNYYYDYPISFGRLPIGTPWGKLIKAKLFLENDCYFVEGYGEDRPCLIKIYGYADKILIINKVLYNYWVHESTMRKYLPNAIEKYSKSLYEMNIYVKTMFKEKGYFLDQLYHFNVAWFSYCTMQDFCHKDNPEKYRERKEKFINALKNQNYDAAFKMADFRNLPFRRKLLAFLIKYKLFRVIDIMSNLNNFYTLITRGNN